MRIIQKLMHTHCENEFQAMTLARNKKEDREFLVIAAKVAKHKLAVGPKGNKTSRILN
jgi:hypothetical protein